MQAEIINNSQHAVPRKFIEEWLKAVSKELRRCRALGARQSSAQITLVFLDKKAARKINFEFRGRDYATDVLSFEALEPGSLGELILCPDVLKKQAQEHGLSYRHELGYMLLHGVLHLLGYDHETNEADARKMFALQDRIFAKLLAKES
ncbi:MAG: rRNA maturation RNase YbeY [Bdellovibrio sp.]